MFFNLLRDWPISKPKKISKNGKVLRLLKRNSMESSGKFEITKKNTPKFDVKNSPLKKPDKKVSTSPFNLMVSLRNQTPLLRRGVMVSCEAPQRSRRWSLKFLELIGGSSKCPQSNAGLPKVESLNESKVGSPGVTAADKKQVTLSWNSLVLSRQSINLASEPLHILSDISKYCDVPRAKMWRLIA